MVENLAIPDLLNIIRSEKSNKLNKKVKSYQLLILNKLFLENHFKLPVSYKSFLMCSDGGNIYNVDFYTSIDIINQLPLKVDLNTVSQSVIANDLLTTIYHDFGVKDDTLEAEFESRVIEFAKTKNSKLSFCVKSSYKTIEGRIFNTYLKDYNTICVANNFKSFMNAFVKDSKFYLRNDFEPLMKDIRLD